MRTVRSKRDIDGAGNVSRQILLAVERIRGILRIRPVTGVEYVPAAKFEQMLSHVAADFLIQAVSRTVHLPDLCAAPASDAINGQSRNPALPFDSFILTRVLECKELIQPLHICMVVTKARFRNPSRAPEHVLEGEAILGVIIGAIIAPIQIRPGIQTKGAIPGVSYGKVASLGDCIITFYHKVVFRALPLSHSLRAPPVRIE